MTNSVCKKIAVVAGSAPPHGAGGISSAHYNLTRALRAQGFDARLFTFADTASDAEDAPMIIRSGSPVFLRKMLNIVCNLVLCLLYGRKKIRYQWAGIIANLPGAWRAGRRIRRFQPDILVLSDHGCPALAILPVPGCKSILVSHHNPARFDNPLLHGRPTCPKDIAWAIALENRALRHVREVICPTRYMRQCFSDTYRFSGPVHVVPNIIDFSVFHAIVPQSPALRLGLPEQIPVVYIPSGTSPVKGERFVCEIMRRVQQRIPHIAFFLSGQPSDGLSYEIQHSILAGSVFYPGQLPYAKNLSYAAGCALCVSPTLAESFGMSLLEAQYFGLPVVTFDVGGNREVVADTVSGYCVKLLDVDALVEKTIFLLADENKAVYDAMAEQAQKQAIDLMREDALRQYVAILESITSRKNTP